MNITKVIGNNGEKQAQNYLKKQKYKIIATNFTCKIGEMDIIAIETKHSRKLCPDYLNMSEQIKSEDVLVFIEVKTRSNINFGTPSQAVDYNKQQKYKNMYTSFIGLNKKYKNMQYRYDIIEVLTSGELNHIKNAF